MRCGRCGAALCRAHAPSPGRRCAGCEADWRDDRATRRTAKALFAPPVAVVAAGITFGALAPVLAAGAISAGLSLLVAGTAAALGTVGMGRTVDRAARAAFLREKSRLLPAARVVRRRGAAGPRRDPGAGVP
jgi:hypothetical protein